MSKSKFFNIGNSIFNKETVVAVHQDKAKVEIEVTIAKVTVMEGGESREHIVYLPSGKNVSDYVKSSDLNCLDN